MPMQMFMYIIYFDNFFILLMIFFSNKLYSSDVLMSTLHTSKSLTPKSNRGLAVQD